MLGLSADTQAALRAHLSDAGREATRDAPLAWLRLEPHAQNYAPAELRLTLWDGSHTSGRERLLATTGFHGGPLDWITKTV